MDGSSSVPSCGAAGAGASSSVDDTHGVDPALLSQLLEMGVIRNLAIRSLMLSGNCSVEAAFTWLSELSAEEQEHLANKPVEDDAQEWEDVDEGEEGQVEEANHKMVLVVNTALGMKPGKVAAQVGHAVLGLYRVLRRSSTTTRQRTLLANWEYNGEKMVVVKASGAPQLSELRQRASSLGLQSYLVSDAGLTQIAEGSQTVLAVFGPGREVDQITGGLKLL